MTRTLSLSTFWMIRLAALIALTALILWTNDAHAQQTASLSQMQKNIGKNVSYVPKLIGMFGYAASAFFATSGLLKMKDWINDSERNTMISALMRLVMASLLLFTPYILKITTGTLGGNNLVQNGVTEQVVGPRMNVFTKS